MKIFVKIICCFMFVIGSSFLSFANSQSISETNSNRMASVIVPLELDGKMKGMPIVKVKIGEKVLRLALDTGADKVFFAITPKALNEINARYSIAIEKNLDAKGTLYKSRTFEIPEAKIGELQLNNVVATEELRDSPDDSEGIIGNRLFDNYNVLIDYSQSHMILYPSTSLPLDLDLAQWTQISFKHENIGIVIQGQLRNQNRSLRFCLDSGVVAANEEGKIFGILQPKSLTAQDKVKDTKTYTDYLTIDGKDVGSMDFYLMDYAQPPVDGFLGYNFFSKYKVFIDFTKQVMYIKANNL
jgi:predicted aspartyl protease